MDYGNKVKFSVIIPLYNKQESIETALKSIFAQTLNNYEIIVVDDGSTDDSLSRVKSMANGTIRIIEQSNSGVAVARNRGIESAVGEFVAFLDADDEWDSGYLETIYELSVRYPEADIFASNYRFCDAKGNVRHTILRDVKLSNATGILYNYFEVASNSHPPLWTSAVVIRKEAIVSVGGFPKNVKSGEDLLTWARLAVKYLIAFCLSPNATYNLGEGYDYSNLPPRKQDSGDPVGSGLKELYKYNHGIVGFRKYISHWHKMRASVAIRYGEKMETIVESCKSLYYNPLNYKVIPFIILSFIPAAIRKKIIVKFKG